MVEYVSCPACGVKADKLAMQNDGTFHYYKVVCYNCGHITEMAYINDKHKEKTDGKE
jgi:Zn ribbon nucleic-acid-binding protein